MPTWAVWLPVDDGSLMQEKSICMDFCISEIQFPSELVHLHHTLHMV